MTATKVTKKAGMVLLLVSLAVSLAWTSGTPKALGPEGGDVRRLAYAPDNPDRIYLGTSSGRLYVSNDAGASWSQLAKLGKGFDYILDNIAIAPRNPSTIYVAAWSIERNAGELFRSHDAGHSWTSMRAMDGQSIRSLAIAASDSKILVAGTLEGVFRSHDAGESWKLISPPNHPDIKNIQSVAVDPQDPNVVYAGTWHLAWKTTDGGANWHQIKRGMIDDSDVFSIIVDNRKPNVVYASACSGIYKSETAGELFSKVQGIPFSARRTRVLKQDPTQPDVVYAGTTEGLWRTTDAGRKWQRISTANLIINDVLVDPRNSNRIMLATDRGGVLISKDNGRSFEGSNTGFTHRQVTSILVDRNQPQTLYAGVVNDKEFGGVFVSKDSGEHWNQLSLGLGKEDIFALSQDQAGRIYAGTNRGLFRFNTDKRMWIRVFPSLVTKSFQVNDMTVEGKNWIAVGPGGIAHSHNAGATWITMRNPSSQSFIAVHSVNKLVIAATHDMLLTSTDGGVTWSRMGLPSVSFVRSMMLDEASRIWIASPQGAFFREAGASTWVHVPGLENPATLAYDRHSKRILAVTGSNNVFASPDGTSWQQVANVGVPSRTLVAGTDQLFAGTTFDGVVALQWSGRNQVAARMATGNSSK